MSPDDFRPLLQSRLQEITRNWAVHNVGQQFPENMWPHGRKSAYDWGAAIIDPLLELSRFDVEPNIIIDQLQTTIQTRHLSEGADSTRWMTPADVEAVLDYIRGREPVGEVQLRDPAELSDQKKQAVRLIETTWDLAAAIDIFPERLRPKDEKELEGWFEKFVPILKKLSYICSDRQQLQQAFDEEVTRRHDKLKPRNPGRPSKKDQANYSEHIQDFDVENAYNMLEEEQRQRNIQASPEHGFERKDESPEGQERHHQERDVRNLRTLSQLSACDGSPPPSVSGRGFGYTPSPSPNRQTQPGSQTFRTSSLSPESHRSSGSQIQGSPRTGAVESVEVAAPCGARMLSWTSEQRAPLDPTTQVSQSQRKKRGPEESPVRPELLLDEIAFEPDAGSMNTPEQSDIETHEDLYIGPSLGNAPLCNFSPPQLREPKGKAPMYPPRLSSDFTPASPHFGYSGYMRQEQNPDLSSNPETSSPYQVQNFENRSTTCSHLRPVSRMPLTTKPQLSTGKRPRAETESDDDHRPILGSKRSKRHADGTASQSDRLTANYDDETHSGGSRSRRQPHAPGQGSRRVRPLSTRETRNEDSGPHGEIKYRSLARYRDDIAELEDRVGIMDFGTHRPIPAYCTPAQRRVLLDIQISMTKASRKDALSTGMGLDLMYERALLDFAQNQSQQGGVRWGDEDTEDDGL